MRRALIALLLVFTIVAPRVLLSQERGATALRALTDGLSTTVRVLVIGAHPDDEDTQLISYLSRGRRVQTAYLSLTRGDGGQNLIGNELGEALGAIRTEELLAARRIDGAEQYFGRAYDFGFSKTAEEAFAHWPKDSLLRDVLSVVREFKPHVIVSVFSGTPRDGHGQHQVAGILAREAFDLADDTVKVPRSMTGGRGAWRVAKFYRGARFSPDVATIKFNIGEDSPLLGRSYAEIAGESRSQHKSQAFGVLQRKGVILDYLRREATHLDNAPDAMREASMFDGIDTTWARVRPARPGNIDSVTQLAASARAAVRADDMRVAARALATLARLAGRLRSTTTTCPLDRARCEALNSDAQASLAWLDDRATRAALIAAGVAIEATVQRETATVGDSVVVGVSVYDRGTDTLRVGDPSIVGLDLARTVSGSSSAVLAPDSVARLRVATGAERLTQPAWLVVPRVGDMFSGGAGRAVQDRNEVVVPITIAGQQLVARAPIVYRYADPVRGEIQHPLAVVPAIAVTLESAHEYVKAGAPVDRVLRAELRSGRALEQRVKLIVTAPPGLRADTPPDFVLPAFARRTVEIRVRGTLPPGAHAVSLIAESGGERYARGYQEIAYDHIRPQRLYRDARTVLHAVDVTVPQVAVGYITGVSDNVAPALKQLGLPVTMLDPASIATENLSKFATIVVGPRAYETGEAMLAANAKLLEYVKNGGRLVVQYGQGEMAQPGIMPFPITMSSPADRVTDENAPVRILNGGAGVLSAPNRIAASDFDGWVQERALYMPRTFDERYLPSLEMNDPGEAPNRGAILVAPVGSGTYVYTTMSLFRQLPAGVPGAARLMMNLISAEAMRPPTTASSGGVRGTTVIENEKAGLR
jgi:LmbE family N-acetylglucosaminyl deacetylase